MGETLGRDWTDRAQMNVEELKAAEERRHIQQGIAGSLREATIATGQDSIAAAGLGKAILEERREMARRSLMSERQVDERARDPMSTGLSVIAHVLGQLDRFDLAVALRLVANEVARRT